MNNKTSMKIGIDVGGTFTDIILLNVSNNVYHEQKVLTNHDNPQIPILEGLSKIIDENSIQFSNTTDVEVIHGTTLFTNALISRSEDPPALFVTEGAEDIIYTGKGNRYDPYDKFLKKPDVLVPKNFRFKVSERILVDGTIFKKINLESIDPYLMFIDKHCIKSVAIVFLHSYKNSIHEDLLKNYLLKKRPDLHISVSSNISPVIGEFDRLNTTCSNAYIQPIAEKYLIELNHNLHAIGIDKFSLIWSDGGLSSLKESILTPIRLLESGPAGGALAVSSISRNSKNNNCIAFDMGGTTAKICLLKDYKPGKASEFEFGRIHQDKPGSGIKVKVPSIHMLEIGAGGGSIARVDELGLLKIGPESAGSDPGPICYDLGGKNVTITDVNLLLGYLSPDKLLAGHLGLDINRTIEVVKQIAQKHNYGFDEYLTGIRKVVNENMSQAIKLHVTELGEDHRQSTIYSFGGAGPLHAYDICKKLQISSFVVPNLAGILSAYGFLTSHISIEKNYSFISLLNNLTFSELNSFVDQCKQKTYDLIDDQLQESGLLEFSLFLEMRYEGQGYDILIPFKPADSIEIIRQNFSNKYIELYGISLDYNIFISAVKISIVQSSPEISLLPSANCSLEKSSCKRDVWFESSGNWLAVDVYDYGSLRTNKEIAGPAIIESKNTTIAVGPDGTFTLLKNGDIKVFVNQSSNEIHHFDFKDPVNLEIILARLRSIADEADRVLMKTAFSSAVRDGKDYSLVICDQLGRAVAMPTECMPLFITCMPRSIRIIAEKFSSNIRPDDIIITNDPWIGSGHKSDTLLVAPLYSGNTLKGYVGTILHVADIGGTIGDFRAWDFYEEGLMIPPMKLFNEGNINSEIIHLIESNVRLPELVLGDIYAMISTIKTISRKLTKLFNSNLELSLNEVADQFSKRMQKAYIDRLSKFPKGIYSGELVADGVLTSNDPVKRQDIELKIKIEITDEDITVDYRGSEKQRERLPINVPYSYTFSDTFYAFQFILFDNVPNLGAQYCPIKIIVDENSILNAKKPVPVYARTRTGIHISSLINIALATAFDDWVMAGCGHNVIFRASGYDEKSKYFAMTFMPKGGLGALATRDGLDCTVYPTNCTMIQTEFAESRAPILVERNLAPDTAGKGKFRGGSGQYVKITSLSDQPLQFSFRPNFMKNPPKGLLGGSNGGSAKILVNGKDQTDDPLVIGKLEYVEVITAGGGGIGDYNCRSRFDMNSDNINQIYS